MTTLDAPHSERATSASSILEECLHKQKFQGVSLTKAIFHSIWSSLPFNGVLAGVSTIASYIGPLLISRFVNLLLLNNNNSNNTSIKYGLILAFSFFLSKTVESLSQRQWYFGAHRIGIRVGAALMAQVYSKSLMIKCAGPTHDGKIINLINVDVDRIGDFYQNVLEGCSLHQDINTWSDGDLTMVGERGVNLSGGQKQRIQLARAVYNDSDVYFLDDPFSAVDSRTGSHLFKECIMNLLYDKTVVYATHQLEFLEAADLILVMKDGQIVESGRYRDLKACPNSELFQQMAAHEQTVIQIPCHKDDSVSSRPCQKNQIEIAEENSQEISMDSNGNQEEEAMTG